MHQTTKIRTKLLQTRKENEIVAASEKEQEVLLKIISESPLMSHLCIQIQKELVSSLKKERAFQKGDCIIEQGGTANCLYILEQGECEVFKKVSEEEGVKKVNVVEQGTCLASLDYCTIVLVQLQ